MKRPFWIRIPHADHRELEKYFNRHEIEFNLTSHDTNNTILYHSNMTVSDLLFFKTSWPSAKVMDFTRVLSKLRKLT
jgi:hypothetical protein